MSLNEGSFSKLVRVRLYYSCLRLEVPIVVALFGEKTLNCLDEFTLLSIFVSFSDTFVDSSQHDDFENMGFYSSVSGDGRYPVLLTRREIYTITSE
jgi:hypothetical protein